MRAAAHATSSASEHMQPSFGGWGWPRKILRHNHEHCQHFSTSQRPTYLSLGLGGLRWSEKNATFHAFGKAVCWRPSRSLFLFREGVKWRVWVLKYQVSTWVRWWVWTWREMKWWKEERGGERESGRNKDYCGWKGEHLRRTQTEGNATWRMWMRVCRSGEKLRGGETEREWNEKSVHGGQREGWEMSWSKKHCKHFFASLESTWIWKEFSPRGNSFSETFSLSAIHNYFVSISSLM